MKINICSRFSDNDLTFDNKEEFKNMCDAIDAIMEQKQGLINFISPEGRTIFNYDFLKECLISIIN